MGSDYAEAKRLFLLINITKTKATKTETTVDTDPDYAEAKRLLNLIQDLKEEISKKMEDANKEFTQKTLQPMRQKIVDELTTLFQLPLAVVDQFVLLQGMLLSGAVFAPPCAVGEYNTFFSGYVSENWDVINKELYYNIATTMLVKAIDANKLNHAEFNTVGIACIRLLRSIIEGADYNFEGGRQDITYQAGNGNQTKAIPEELYNYYQELGDLETVKDGESTETTFMEKFVTKLLKWCDDFSEARMNSPMFQAIFSDNRDAYINHSKFLTLLRVWIEERNQNRHLEVSQIINKLFPGNELTQGVAAGFARMHQVKEALCYITKVNDTAAIETLEKTKEQNANAQYDFYWVPNASHKNGGTFYYYIDGVCEVELEDYQPLQLFLSNKGKNEMNKRIDVTSPEGYKIIQAVYVHRERIITDSRAMEQRAKQFYNKEPRSAATASTEGSQSGPSGSSMLPTEAARRQAELAEAALRRQRSGSLAASSSSDVSTTAAAVRKPAPQAAPALNRTESLPGMRRASPPKGDDATATPAARGRGRGGRGRGGRGIGQVHQGSMSMQLPPHAGADAAVHGGMQFQLPVVGSQPVILKSSQGPSTSAGSVARQDSKQLEHPVVASPSTSSSSSVDTTGSTEGRGPAPELPARRPSPPKDVEPSPATPVSSVSDTAAAWQQPQVPRRGPSMPAVERKIVPLHQQSVKVVRYEDWETTVAALESQKANTMAMSISNKTVYYAYCKEDGTCVSKSIAVGDNHILKNGYTCLSEKLLDLKGGFLGSNNPEFERKDSTWYNVYHMICSAERIKPHQSSPPRVNDNGASSSSAQGASSSKPAVRQRTPTMKFSLGAAEGSSQQPVVREKPVASEKPEHLRSALTQSGNSFAANPNGRGRGVPQPGRGRALPPQPGRGRGGQE